MNWFWDNIHLKKEERKGMLLFVCILFSLILVKWYMVTLYTPDIEDYNIERFATVEYALIEPDIQQGKASSKASYSHSKKKWQTKKAKKKSTFKNEGFKKKGTKQKSQLFNFDPNYASLDSLLLLGLSKYAANNITKYRSKGGKFKTAADLQKIYGIDSLTFKSINSYVKIDQTKPVTKASGIKYKSIAYTKPKLELNSIDINAADTTEFRKLNGIGKVYANRIVKFRSSLGGYFSIDQIKDVWGISDSLFIAIKPYLAIDKSLLEKRNINLLEKEELVKHPYIDWKKAKVILSYKKMHGDYKSMEDFKKMHGIDDAFIDTLTHYFVAQ